MYRVIMISYDLGKGTMVNHDLARLTMIMASVPWLRTLGNFQKALLIPTRLHIEMSQINSPQINWKQAGNGISRCHI